MPNLTSFSEFAGIFKESWENKIVETFAGDAPIMADAQFEGRDVVGGKFHRPTRLTLSGGQSFAAASVAGTNITPGIGSSYAYVGARSGIILDAQITGMQIHGRDQITYEALSRSMQNVNAEGPDAKKAVIAGTKALLDGLLAATVKKTEALFIHGGMGLGTIEACSEVVARTTTNQYESTDGYAIDVRISDATWADAIWMTFEGHTFDFFTPTSGLPAGAKINTAANSLLSGTNQKGLVLTHINPSTLLTGLTGSSSRVLRFFHTSGTAGGSGTGIIGGATYALMSAAVACFESAGPSSEFYGLRYMAQNSGTLFSIDSTLYSMYRGNAVDLNGAPVKLAEVVRYASRAINAGAKGKKMRAVVPTEAFAQFANDESILRRYSAESKSGKGGMHNLELYLPMGGTLEVLGHSQQVNGSIVIYPPEELVRVGSQDINFVTRGGGSNNEMVLDLSTSPTSEVRLFGMMAPVIDTPRHCVAMSNFVY